MTKGYEGPKTVAAALQRLQDERRSNAKEIGALMQGLPGDFAALLREEGLQGTLEVEESGTGTGFHVTATVNWSDDESQKEAFDFEIKRAGTDRFVVAPDFAGASFDAGTAEQVTDLIYVKIIYGLKHMADSINPPAPDPYEP